jgi:hypothetical protein
MSNTDNLLDKLTNAVTFKFKEDKTAPGVTVSRLKKGYYCSVVRYSGAFAKGKQVVCHARGDDLHTTIKTLATSFVAMTAQPRDPVQELGELLHVQKA